MNIVNEIENGGLLETDVYMFHTVNEFVLLWGRYTGPIALRFKSCMPCTQEFVRSQLM